jgi:hypothetical protein
MKQKQRYRRKRKGGGLVAIWPELGSTPAEVAERVRYVGSQEHKDRPVDPSYEFQSQPQLRSDASRCDSGIERTTAEQALRQGIRRQCVSAVFVGDFPLYVWAWLGGRPYQARVTNATQGHYKGWPVEAWELPTDRDGRLSPSGWQEDA